MREKREFEFPQQANLTITTKEVLVRQFRCYWNGGSETE
jgi:hypothetical protein